MSSGDVWECGREQEAESGNEAQEVQADEECRGLRGAFFTDENSWPRNAAHGTGKRIGRGIWGKEIFHRKKRWNHEINENHVRRRPCGIGVRRHTGEGTGT
ncbi:hypothetical protein LBMAG56_47070 [Verrucomicrobiota bacterium]|nr:hypothetical protein LBMAG56_47070 [Verrucomicrobiota bacterium]